MRVAAAAEAERDFAIAQAIAEADQRVRAAQAELDQARKAAFDAEAAIRQAQQDTARAAQAETERVRADAEKMLGQVRAEAAREQPRPRGPHPLTGRAETAVGAGCRRTARVQRQHGIPISAPNGGYSASYEVPEIPRLDPGLRGGTHIEHGRGHRAVRGT
jgi:hypothetical protein